MADYHFFKKKLCCLLKKDKIYQADNKTEKINYIKKIRQVLDFAISKSGF